MISELERFIGVYAMPAYRGRGVHLPEFVSRDRCAEVIARLRQLHIIVREPVAIVEFGLPPIPGP